jgi:isoleucyl-tRNA synthetase
MPWRGTQILADWERPYKTMDPQYESAQLSLFAEMHAQGLVVQGFKPVFWSPSSRSALAEAELEYHDHVSQSVYVKFSLMAGPVLEAQLDRLGASGASALSWTTTPWTLPANRALAINPRLKYVLAEVSSASDGGGDRQWIVCAESLLPAVLEKCGLTAGVVEAVTAAALVESQYAPLSTAPRAAEGDAHQRPIVDADYVTEDSGTGIVHTAPAHGVDDFRTCERHGVALGPMLVDNAGRFTADAGDFNGLNVLTEGNQAVITQLDQDGTLLHHEP